MSRSHALVFVLVAAIPGSRAFPSLIVEGDTNTPPPAAGAHGAHASAGDAARAKLAGLLKKRAQVWATPQVRKPSTLRSDHRQLAFGIELELCERDGEIIEIPGFQRKDDATIECMEGSKRIELVYAGAVPESQLSAVVANISRVARSMAPCLMRSCGTHVHVSQVGVDAAKHDPNMLLRRWLDTEQERMFRTYYTVERVMSRKNTAADHANSTYTAWQGVNPEPALMLRTDASPDMPLHFEFRGYPCLPVQPLPLFEEYLRAIAAFWHETYPAVGV